MLLKHKGISNFKKTHINTYHFIYEANIKISKTKSLLLFYYSKICYISIIMDENNKTLLRKRKTKVSTSNNPQASNQTLPLSETITPPSNKRVSLAELLSCMSVYV